MWHNCVETAVKSQSTNQPTNPGSGKQYPGNWLISLIEWRVVDSLGEWAGFWFFKICFPSVFGRNSMTTVNNICYHVTHRDQGSVELELPMAQAVQVSLSFCPSAHSLRHPLLLMFLHSGCIWGVYSHLQWLLIKFF